MFDKIEGANGPELANKVEKYSQVKESAADDQKPEEDLNARLKKLINYAPVMLFMKGTPAAPQCGFSRKAVEILQKHNIQFSSFNILSDEQVRQGLKVGIFFRVCFSFVFLGILFAQNALSKRFFQTGPPIRNCTWRVSSLVASIS